MFVRLTLVGRMVGNKNNIFNYKKNQAWAEHMTIVMQLGLTMAGCIVFCFFVGRYLDRWLGTGGLFVAIFTVLGVIGGAVTAYRQILEITADPQKDSDAGNGSA
jgi:ATP synthase protein I